MITIPEINHKMQKTILSQVQISDFQNKIYIYFKKSGRMFPWRKNNISPYHILISEIMLQQTQTDRVISKYEAFIKRFPDINTLAQTSFSQIFEYWHGLGYNRRAKYLKLLSEKVVNEYAGKLPSTFKELIKLPGIGKYTAAAIEAFAFNQPTIVIETNIRTVYIHEFFTDGEKIHDNLILPLIKQTLNKSNPRVWYWALMDYGTNLKKKFPNPSRRSTHYSKQSTFVGSDRQVRGMILKLLLNKPLNKDQLIKQIPRPQELIQKIIAELKTEGLIIEQNNRYLLG